MSMDTATAKRIVIGSMLVIVIASTVRRIANDKAPTIRAPIGGLFAAAGLTALAGPAPAVAANMALIALVAEVVVDGPYLIAAANSATGAHKPTAPIVGGMNEAAKALQDAVNGIGANLTGTRWWSSQLGASVGGAASSITGSASGIIDGAGADGMVKFKSAQGQTLTASPRFAAPLAAMILAAKNDGVRLTGSIWRSNERQKELRKINGCPDVMTSPASSCRVPTAIPGTSMHERGEAIDFDNCGRSSAAFRWLQANAGRWGIKNLPSESWHWSLTGG